MAHATLDASPLNLYRFECPHCRRRLKAAVDWAGRRGVCPACQQGLDFPRTDLRQGHAAADQILAVLGHADVPLDADTTDRCATLLSQGTCGDYAAARQLLPAGRLSVRQWRRVLVAAAGRERLRLRQQARMDDPLAVESLLQDADPLPHAWHIFARFVHHVRHATCADCGNHPDGAQCQYLSFDAFLLTAAWTRARRNKWHRTITHALGLPCDLVAEEETPADVVA